MRQAQEKESRSTSVYAAVRRLTTQSSGERKEAVDQWVQRVRSASEWRPEQNTPFGRVHHLLEHRRAQRGITLLILLNLLVNMMQAGCAHDAPCSGMGPALAATDVGILVIFTVEIAARATVLRWRLLFDGWAVFDLLIVVTSWALQLSSAMRTVRILRALRLLKQFKRLKQISEAMYLSLPRILWVCVLALLLTAIFAVIGIDLYGVRRLPNGTYEALLYGEERDVDYFGSLGTAFLTLMKLMTLEAWPDIVDDVTLVHGGSGMTFYASSFIFLSNFVLFNVMIALLVHSLTEHLHTKQKHNSEEEEVQRLDGAIVQLEHQIRKLRKVQREVANVEVGVSKHGVVAPRP